MGVSGSIKATADNADLLSTFFAEFLDEAAFSEFRRIERLFGSLLAQGSTVSGYPVIRPGDCGRITLQLKTIFKTARQHFRTRDAQLTERFERLIGAFHAFCQKVYPSEATGALILHAEVLLFMGQADRVVEMVSPLALRPYAVENNVVHCVKLVRLLAQAHAIIGTIDRVPISFVAFCAWASAYLRGVAALKAIMRLASFANCGVVEERAGPVARLIRWSSRHYLSAVRERNGLISKALWLGLAFFHLAVMMVGYKFIAATRRGRLAPFSLHMDKGGPILVTRAMGGIGDLLMMQPGLEALALSTGRRVDFAIPAKFFPIFANDANIQLVDIDGPPLDVSGYSRFYNLSICPAGGYESRKRPNVDKGRVELFARGMGVSLRNLKGQGWRINRANSSEENAFCDRFLAEKGLGSRPLIGVQPYSRDSYKDHPGIADIIKVLSADYDILFFHHLPDGLPQGPGFASTAGVPLGNSLALVSRLDAMVCVDSAFLHAAAAYDIPVVAMFGPTDARTFTRHHRRITILWKPETFGCVPCWRNEDLPCHLTKTLSASPCVAKITPQEVLTAVQAAMVPAR